ncbi:Replication factor C subunit 3 [Smittium culicis]|uniref:Replication factor C subunit 3 n=1 Tax=Smittium culicis TaxID=133412 RepID=A0A1R1XSB0_9FUNG|nr:Replication factor C subunit 3 [Smittium culicis]
MTLWVDKNRPTTLDKLSYHHELTSHLKKMAETLDIPHLLFYGPEGAVMIRMDTRTFQTTSSRSVEVNILSSNYHIEINPSDAGIYDRVIVQELIKEIAQTQQVNSSSLKKFKVVVIHDADTLSKNAQHALRRTMEKYMVNLRIIMCCSSTGNIIPPLQSRCLMIRVPAPSSEDVSKVLLSIASTENFQLSEKLATRISHVSNQNLRKAVLLLEASYVSNYPFTDDMELPLPDWEVAIVKLAKKLLSSQSPMVVMEARTSLYELLTHCIPPSVILKQLALYLVDHVDETMKPEIISIASQYEERLNLGQKAIFHLEAFVARFQSVYKRFLSDLDFNF